LRVHGNPLCLAKVVKASASREGAITILKLLKVEQVSGLPSKPTTDQEVDALFDSLAKLKAK
jgi:hypothetical protein